MITTSAQRILLCVIAAVVSPVSALVIGALVLMFILILGIVMLAAALSTNDNRHAHAVIVMDRVLAAMPWAQPWTPPTLPSPPRARGGALHQCSLSAPLAPKIPEEGETAAV